MQRSLRATGLLACFVIAGCSQIIDFDRSKIAAEDAGGGNGGTIDAGKSDSGLPDAAMDAMMSIPDAQMDGGGACDPVTNDGCGRDQLCCDGDEDGKFECIATDPAVQCERCGMPCNSNTSDDCTDRTCGCGWKTKVPCSGELSLCDPTTSECVECLVNTDCDVSDDRPYCFKPGDTPTALDNTCVECDPETNAGCGGTKPICNAMAVCVPCTVGPKTCVSPLVCLSTGACECSDSDDCTTPTTPICDTTSKQCEGCASNQECVDERALPYCVDNQRCAACNPTSEAGCSDVNKPDCRFNGANVYECQACTTNDHCDNLGTKDTCDTGTGACVECLVNGDCAGSEYCSNKVCTAKKANGQSCSAAAECTNGNCVDGVCCDGSCTGTCVACSASKKGSGANGTCGPVISNSDPDNECAGALACNGASACEKALGDACTLGSECDSTFCADGVCCNEACGGACEACTAALSTGANGTCSQAETDTDPGNRCAGALQCTAAGVCEKAQGEACTADAECGSDHCVNNFCCDEACDGACEACSAALSTGANGTCSPAETNTDPGDLCAGALACTAAGVCEKADGVSCSAGSECDSGNCVDSVCCNTACAGTCVACTAAKKGAGSDGTCDFVTAGDPDMECVPTQCDGAGACVP